MQSEQEPQNIQPKQAEQETQSVPQDQHDENKQSKPLLSRFEGFAGDRYFEWLGRLIDSEPDKDAA